MLHSDHKVPTKRTAAFRMTSLYACLYFTFCLIFIGFWRVDNSVWCDKDFNLELIRSFAMVLYCNNKIVTYLTLNE